MVDGKRRAVDSKSSILFANYPLFLIKCTYFFHYLSLIVSRPPKQLRKMLLILCQAKIKRKANLYKLYVLNFLYKDQILTNSVYKNGSLTNPVK